jgi:hypothetical protein
MRKLSLVDVGVVALGVALGVALLFVGLLDAARFTSPQRLLKAIFPFYWAAKASLLSAVARGPEASVVLRVLDMVVEAVAVAEIPAYLWLGKEALGSRWARITLGVLIAAHVALVAMIWGAE